MNKFKVVLWTLRLLLGVFFIMAGMGKINNGAGGEEHLMLIYERLGDSWMLLASVSEVLGGVLIILPFSSIYASMLLALVMLVAVVMSISVSGISSAVFPLVLVLLLLVTIVMNKIEPLQV